MAVEKRSAELKIRIKPSLKAAITRAAEHDHRSVSNWVEALFEETIARYPAATAKKRTSKSRP
jgi:hypothetical protein